MHFSAEEFGNARLHTPNRQPYDRFRLCTFWGTYENDREHVVVYECLQSLRPHGGLRLSLTPPQIISTTCLLLRADLTTSITTPISSVSLQTWSGAWPNRDQCWSLAFAPHNTSILIPSTTGWLVVRSVPRMRWGVHSWSCAHHTPLKLLTTLPHSEGVINFFIGYT